MMIRFGTLPFALVILASVMPWVAAVFDSKLVALMPDLIMLVLFATLSLWQGRFYNPRPLTLLLFITVAHTMIGILDGRGIGSGGMVLLLAEIFIFLQWMEMGGARLSNRKIHQFVTRLYQLHLGFLLFELLMRLNGFMDLFVAIAGGTSVTAGYKTYNSAALLNHFGIPGLNSLLLGSQSASQLTLFAMFWFFPYFRNIPPEFQQERLIPWFLLALLLYPVNATMTANILLMIFLFILMFVFKESFLSSKAAKFILLTIVILFSDKIYQMLSFRINSPNDIDVYLFAYYHFYEVYINLGIYKQMLGWGSDILSSQIKDTNFGLGALIFQAGIILFGSFFVLFYVIYRNLLRVTNWLRGCGTPQLRGTMLLAGMNGILSLGWAVSLIHYTPAVELGGRQMFALHTALCLFLLHRIRSESKLARLQIVQAPS